MTELINFLEEDPELGIVLTLSPVLSFVLLTLLLRMILKDIMRAFGNNSIVEKMLRIFEETSSDIKEVNNSIKKNTEVSQAVVKTINDTTNDTLDHIFAVTKSMSAFKEAFETRSQALKDLSAALQVDLSKLKTFANEKTNYYDAVFRRVEEKVDSILSHLVVVKGQVDETKIKELIRIALETMRTEIGLSQPEPEQKPAQEIQPKPVLEKLPEG